MFGGGFLRLLVLVAGGVVMGVFFVLLLMGVCLVSLLQ